MHAPGNTEFAVDLLRRFSTAGVTAVVLVIGTGALNAFFVVPEWRHFFGSLYGRTLLAKLFLVAAMVALALLNRALLIPRSAAGTEQTVARWRRNVAVETTAGALVVLAASLLGTLPPPS